MTISKNQPIREAEIELIDTVNELTETINSLANIVSSIPSINFGVSESFSVAESNYDDITINFDAPKSEIPYIFCTLQNETNDYLSLIVTHITNSNFTVRVYNFNATKINGITFDWLAIYGR